MTLKPCIQCGKDCEILPVQLGDIFTLSFLRICGGECMFLLAYDQMRNEGKHKEFRAELQNLQNEEDEKLRDEYVHDVTEEALKMQLENLKNNPNLLSTPAPECMLKMFKDPLPCSNLDTIMRFTRPTKAEKLDWAQVEVKRLQDELTKALQEVKSLENEMD